MKNLIITTLVATTLLMGGSLFGAQLSFGIRIGPPPAPLVQVVPASPGSGYSWVDGYWYPVEQQWKWHRGYYTRGPYSDERWITPRYDGGMFYNGYWDGGHGRIDHDHHWDGHRDRDYRGNDRRHDRERHH